MNAEAGHGSGSVPLLTRSGLGAGAVAIAAGLLGWWWRYEELVVLAAAIVAALAAAIWTARIGRSADVVRRVLTPRVARGEDVRLVYRLRNDSRVRIPAAVIVDRCDGVAVRIDAPPVSAGDEAELRAQLPTHRRGVHEIGPWALERSDPFGLAVGSRSAGDVGMVIVHPRVHRLGGPYGAMHVVETESVVRRTASDPLSGFVSLREYVQGDDPRLIHWPTTARLGTLMIREHVELRRPEFTVVVDAADTVATPDDFEEMVDVAASVAVHAIRSGVDVTLRTTSRSHSGTQRSVGQEQVVLDLLTPLRQEPADRVLALSELFATGLDHTAIVMVTGPDGPASVLARSAAISVIRVGRGARSGPGVALAVEHASEFADRWRPWR